MPRNRRLCALCLCLTLTGFATMALGDDPQTDRPYLLERVDDAAVVQVYADGFAELPLRQKILIWHLYQAAIAGRDIYYDQRYDHSLEMRQVLESILTHADGIEPETLNEIQRYTKLFWLNSGPYNHITSRKFVLKCSPGDFLKAIKAARSHGAVFPHPDPEETAEEMVDRLRPMFFDPHFEPIVTNKSPGPGKDILASSANNLYANVEMKDLQGFKEQYPLNSRLVKRGGTLIEEPYTIAGKYAEPIARIVSHLDAAASVAPEPTSRALKSLIRFYQTGQTEDRRAYDIAWVEDKDAPVDTINGFIEVYMDPRGIKGSWEAAVFYVNKEKTEAIKKLAAEAQWFEDHMPWDEKFRKPNVKGITANAIEVVIETGDCGPVTPIGINLPNDQQIREQHGSKSVSLSNIIEAYDKSSPESFREEFSWTPEEAERAKTWGTLGQELLVNMHEVIGHASGRLSESFQGQPHEAIKEYYSALEEGRADLVALYYITDPKLAELRLVPKEDQDTIARTVYENYTRNVLVQLRRIQEGSQIEEDHMRNRQMVIRWLMDHSDAIEIRHREGKTYYVMKDVNAFHEGVGRLLAEVQRIKSEGDYDAAKNLFEQYGIHFDPVLRDEVLARVNKLDLPSYTGFVMPRLEPVHGSDGTIQDVTISYPQNLTSQMLNFSGYAR